MQRKLSELLSPEIGGLGYELLLVEYEPGERSSLVRLYIDAEAGIGLADCEKVSRAISTLLDVEDPIPGEYRLEVSSPGLDRPLATPEHFRQFCGSLAKVKLAMPLDGRSNFKGRITACDEDTLALEVDGVDYQLPLADVEKARLVPQYD